MHSIMIVFKTDSQCHEKVSLFLLVSTQGFLDYKSKNWQATD